MRGQLPSRSSKMEPDPDPAASESTSMSYNWGVPMIMQNASPGLQASNDPVSGREELPGPSLGERTAVGNRQGKVPIPRNSQTIPWTSMGRTSRACENCREQKAKCSGHHPTCNRCKDAGIPCSYGDRKREKILKQIDSLKAQVQTYETVLREVYPRLDMSSAQYVDQTLGGLLVRPSSSPASHSEPAVGSDHPLSTNGHTEEDFNRDEKQALGFVGEQSEMTWLYRLKRDLEQDTQAPFGEPIDRPSISSLNYVQEDLEVFTLEVGDVLGRPSQSTADKLVDTFFDEVHPCFPIIGKGVFLGQYKSFYSNPTLRPGKRWMAVLNLVFAIASKYSMLLNPQSQEEEPASHLVYFSRAWRLSMGNVALLDHPNLQQVQVEGLAALYLLATGQANRSWRMIGIAIRSAVAMGLNLRSESYDIAYFSKETRYRVWWALFLLDTLLCVMIGRPPSSSESFCTTPLPIPFREEDFGDEEVKQLIMDSSQRQNLLKSLLTQVQFPSMPTDSTTNPLLSVNAASGKGKQPAQTSSITIENLAPNISLTFLYLVDLAFLMRDAIETLYSPGAARRSWMEMENSMSTFNASADKWLSRLPEEFRFTNLDADQPFARQRASLAFYFYSTKLVIAQPCHRRLAYQTFGEVAPGSLCSTLATVCVNAARDMLSLLPNETDIQLLYKVAPQWSILHHIMQSTTIIFVQFFTRTEPGTMEAAGLVADIHKAIRWLREMATRDTSSQRALAICTDILSRHGFEYGLEVNLN